MGAMTKKSKKTKPDPLNTGVNVRRQRATAENLAKGMTAEKAITISSATTQHDAASYTAS
jgi:hypothetical protein